MVIVRKLLRGSVVAFGALLVGWNLAFAAPTRGGAPAPSNLVATATSPTQISLNWKYKRSKKVCFRIERRLGLSGKFSRIATTKANITKYTDSSKLPSTTYYYRIRAYNRLGTSAYSRLAVATTLSSSSSTPIPTFTSTATPTPDQPSAHITVPIVVSSGTINSAVKSVSLTLDAIQASAVALDLQIHGLTYENKASVGFNGTWVSLNNTTAAVKDPGKSYGGIGGQFSTLGMTIAVPTGSLVAGSNTLSFRFNGTDGTSMDYRVLKFNLLSSTGQSLIPSSFFVQEDPNTWQPPLNDPTSIAAGKALWNTAILFASPLESTRKLKAHCSDCHMSDGRDLKYFNYSNEVIRDRAIFHGLTSHQGDQLASYIRSLSVPNPGRPWNPPFQPGPGIDSRPQNEWAAGAGINYALDHDSDTLTYLFPNGITKDAIPTSGTVKVREIPVQLQLLDWNHWLPTVHPKDSSMATEYAASPIEAHFDNMVTNLSGSNRDSYIKNSKGLSRLDVDLYDWFVVDRLYNFFGVYPGSNNHPWSPQVAEEVYSIAQLGMVKYLGMVMQFDLETYGPIIYGSTGEYLTAPGPGAFLTSPFMLLIRNGQSGSLSIGSMRATYLSNAWYHTQLILNAGNRKHGGNNPVDWPYYFGFVQNISQLTKLPEAARLTLLLVKGMQETDNANGLNKAYGWNPTSASDPHILVNDEFKVTWVGYAQAVKTAVMQAMLGAWFDKAKQFTAAQYQSSSLMTDFTNGNWMGPNSEGFGPFVTRLFLMIPEYRKNAVNQTLLNDVADWAATIYPQGTWTPLKVNDASWMSRVAPADGSVMALGTPIKISVYAEKARPVRIDFYDGSNFLGTVTDYNHTNGKYELTVTLEAGSHRLYTRGTTAAGVVSTSWVSNITVQ